MSTIRMWVVLVLMAASAPAFAQDQDQVQAQAPNQMSTDSRAALLAGARDQKATEATPPERSTVERALYRYDNSFGTPFIFQNWHGVHLAGGGFPGGAGTGVGVGFSHALGRVLPAADPNRANRVTVEALGAYTARGYSRASAGFDVRRLGGSPLDVRVRAQHYEYPQQDFFGIGADSQKENRTNYLLRSTEANAELHWNASRFWDVSGGVAYLTPTIGSGTDSRYPSTNQLFNPSTLPGYQQQADFLRADAAVAFDWRDNPLHPHAGGRYGVQFSDYRDQTADAFNFRKITIDAQQYVPIPDRYRTIALHAAAVFTDPSAGQDVPFYLQPSLGGPQALRGFREFRFQDRNSLLMSAEYRWEAWWALDGALFVDAGTVAAERTNLKLRDLDVSYGVGLRIHSNSAFVARLDFAFSREGFIPLLRFEHAF